MLTQAEGTRIKEIKAKLLQGQAVPRGDAQWVLDMLAREKLAIRPGVKQRAQADGYNVQGIVTE